MKKTRYLRRFKPILTNEEVFYINQALDHFQRYSRVKPNTEVFAPLRQEFAGYADQAEQSVAAYAAEAHLFTRSDI
jgi:hypothetical protein